MQRVHSARKRSNTELDHIVSVQSLDDLMLDAATDDCEVAELRERFDRAGDDSFFLAQSSLGAL